MKFKERKYEKKREGESDNERTRKYARVYVRVKETKIESRRFTLEGASCLLAPVGQRLVTLECGHLVNQY